jgi:CheY-like chemotaxis protein
VRSIHGVGVAVTVEALRGDREKCLAAGASDYITNSVESEICFGSNPEPASSA